MKLDLATYRVKRITQGPETHLSRGELQVNLDQIRKLVLSDDLFRDVKVHLVHPGDQTRIVHALDVVEPRHKASGPGTVFPGVLGAPVSVGEGRTHRLAGAMVVTVGEAVIGEPVYWREAIFDMAGVGAPYCPFSQTANLVLELIPAGAQPSDTTLDGRLDNTIAGSSFSQAYNRAVRVAGFKVADYLASVTKEMVPEQIDTYELTPADPSLPKVFYASEEAGQFLYGGVMGWQPTLLHPNELADGVIFRSFNGPASIREVSYFYQSHQVIEDMYRRHGKEICFSGVVLYPFGGQKLDEKERITSFATSLLRLMGADGVVISWIGGGHPGIDPMLLCQKCEAMGIRTTILNPEMASTPEDTGFVHYVPEADAIVSVGNYEVPVDLPAMPRVIGGKKLHISGLDAAGPLSITIRHLLGASSPLGNAKLMGVQY